MTTETMRSIAGHDGKAWFNGIDAEDTFAKPIVEQTWLHPIECTCLQTEHIHYKQREEESRANQRLDRRETVDLQVEFQGQWQFIEREHCLQMTPLNSHFGDALTKTRQIEIDGGNVHLQTFLHFHVEAVVDVQQERAMSTVAHFGILFQLEHRTKGWMAKPGILLLVQHFD